jgi:hypothetical protein
VELLYGTQEKRERKENDRASEISHNKRYEGGRYKAVY